MPTDIVFGGDEVGTWAPPFAVSGDAESWRLRARHMHDLGVVSEACLAEVSLRYFGANAQTRVCRK